MTDGVVQIPPDSSGKKIDTSELTRSDGTVVERQRVVIADPLTAGNFLTVAADGSLSVGDDQIEHLARIEAQLKRVARLLEILAGQHIALDQVF